MRAYCAKCLTANSAVARPFRSWRWNSEIHNQKRPPTHKLFPDSSRPLFGVFTSEGKAEQALDWVRGHAAKRSPLGILYWVNDRFLFRCRDREGNEIEAAGPNGNPLALSEELQIYHFFVDRTELARAYIVTQTARELSAAVALTKRVKELLGPRLLFLHIRGDPWYLGESPDTIPYYFASDIPPSLEEYRKSRTLTCSSDEGCGKNSP